MAIDVKNITTTLTLEIDEESIGIADYQKASESFLKLVLEISKQTQGREAAENWEVKVYSGSAGIGVSPRPGVDGELVQRILTAGLKLLAKGVRPIEFTDKAIEYSIDLAQLFKKAISPRVNIWSGRDEAISVTREIGRYAELLLAPAYEEDGSVDGRLEKLNGHNKLSFEIFDVIDDRVIRCEIPEKFLDIALRNFMQRVEVIGKVKYRKDGMPVSINASKIIEFPRPEKIPSLERMGYLLSGKAAI